jgi:hypothetical protein
MKWTTKDGRQMSLQEMETTHIRNSLAKMRRSIRTIGPGIVTGWRLQWIGPMTAELKRRELLDRPAELNPALLTNRFRNLDFE